jgi:two-component system chemotaxis response regulator CheY
MKALVVDDDMTTRILLQKILSVYAEVHSCADGDEAVLSYKSALERGEPYDLICIDVFMPKTNGIKALNLIRREEELHPSVRPLDTKVIMTTASDDSDTINQAFRGLCDAYVLKPIDTEEFNKVVDGLLPIEHRT